MKDKRKFKAIPCLIFTYNPYSNETDTLYSNTSLFYGGRLSLYRANYEINSSPRHTTDEISILAKLYTSITKARS